MHAYDLAIRRICDELGFRYVVNPKTKNAYMEFDGNIYDIGIIFDVFKNKYDESPYTASDETITEFRQWIVNNSHVLWYEIGKDVGNYDPYYD